MGIYLNSIVPYKQYKKITSNYLFIDKSLILTEIIPLIGSSLQYVCITRPRRFGKTVMANMIASYFAKNNDSEDIFSKCAIGTHKEYMKHRNQYDVIFISFNEQPEHCTSYQDYINRIISILKRDLQQTYCDLEIDEKDSVWDILTNIFTQNNLAGYIFIFDEWDYIFHQDYATEDDTKDYIKFLSNLLKDKPYVLFSYMTGILPIAKYSSGSELNMFLEYSMTRNPKYSEYFGFTEAEVNELFKRYLLKQENPSITKDELRIWYDGYDIAAGLRLYNPRSVVAALSNNHIDNYWTSSGPYDEIFYYIQNNKEEVKDSLALLISGEDIPANIEEYGAVSRNIYTKDEIFSAMVVYGFLCYKNGYVRIPNKELMDQFSKMVKKEQSLGYIHQLAKISNRMLEATLAADTKVMSEILDYAHNTESPILTYNHEIELSAIVTLVYLSARERYRIEREDKEGKGFVDFIFYPLQTNNDGIILELKVDDTAEHALKQIHTKDYALKFQGKLGEIKKYSGRIILVGIAYFKDTKKHECKVEIVVPSNTIEF